MHVPGYVTYVSLTLALHAGTRSSHQNVGDMWHASQVIGHYFYLFFIIFFCTIFRCIAIRALPLPMKLLYVLALAAHTCAAASNNPTNWTDCGLPNATIHFDIVDSTNPVHTNERQYINKTLHMDHSYSNMTTEYAQYWKVFGKWFKFLDLKVNTCAEHPEICNAKPGKEIFVSTIHPPLNKLTPHGMYRSKQHYFDDTTGELLGCVDMMIPYVK